MRSLLCWNPQSALELFDNGSGQDETLDFDVGDLFFHRSLVRFAAPTPDASNDLRHAASRLRTTMAHHNVLSLLPLSVLLDEFSASAIEPSRTRILAIECLLCARHLALGLDVQTPKASTPTDPLLTCMRNLLF